MQPVRKMILVKDLDLIRQGIRLTRQQQKFNQKWISMARKDQEERLQ